MFEIKENQELNIRKLLSFRGKVKQTELESIGKEMEAYIQSTGAKSVGNPITATFAVEGELMDIELLIPLDKEIDSTERFVYKDQLLIVNAVVACFKGHPMGLQEACMQLNRYIVERKLQPITVGYNNTVKTDSLNLENTEVDVYVGINPNIT